MIGVKFAQRGLGIVSTIILARLLIPEDFGLVAMAMTVYALVHLIGKFGFDLALIQNQSAERRHYDTAWTFNVLSRSVIALLLVAGAGLVANLFNEPRLEAVIYVIAFMAFVQGFENIGIVAFRKDIQFNKEFNFQVAKKAIAFITTVGLAVAFRNYWALVLGMLTSHLGGVILSYLMHPYRPRPSFDGSRDLFSFSSWVLLNGFIRYLSQRGPDFLIARLAGASSLGLYTVAREIATLPTTELYMPIMRVVFPGFSKISHDLPRLRQGYLDVQGVVATVALPAGLMIVVLAEPLVHLALGRNWIGAIPLVQALGLHGVIQVLHGNRYSLFMALGQPYWIGLMMLAYTLITLPSMAFLLMSGYGLDIVAWVPVVASVILLPIGVLLVTRSLSLSGAAFFGVLLRPIMAGISMAVMIKAVLGGLPMVDGPFTAAFQLSVAAPIGALTYVAILLSLWRASGSPYGAEARLLEMIGLARMLPRKQLGTG